MVMVTRVSLLPHSRQALLDLNSDCLKLTLDLLQWCRDLKLVKKKTHRGFRGGKQQKRKLSISGSASVQSSVSVESDCDQCASLSSSPLSSVSSCDFPLTLAGLCDSDSVGVSVSVCQDSFSSSSCSDIKSSNIIIGLLNVWSSLKKGKDICDLIVNKSLDVLVITETWLSEQGDEVAIIGMTPHGYTFHHRPRSSGQSGGGIALIHRNSINVTLCADSSYPSFESLDCVISYGKISVRTVALYRPPPSDKNQLKDSMFYEDFGQLVSSLSNKTVLILGDFNFHWDVPTNGNTRTVKQILDAADLVQHVDRPTHRDGHTLDWIVTRSDKSALVQSVTVEDPLISDHFLVSVVTDMSRPPMPKKRIEARNLKKIDMELFRQDLRDSDLFQAPPADVDDLVQLYNDTLSSLLNTHAPLTVKCVPDRPDNGWFGPSVLTAKADRRRAEKRWRRSGLEVDRQIYQKARNRCTQAVRAAKSAHIQSLLEAAGTDSRKMFSVVNDLLGKKSSPSVLPALSDNQAASALSSFFLDKIQMIRSGFDSDIPDIQSTFSGVPLCEFHPVTEEQLRKIITKSKATSCVVDPIPTRIVLECLDILLPGLVQIINSSLQSASVPRPLKTAVIKPLLKKTGLDPNECKNFRPVSNLPYLSKLLERVVCEQLMQHLNIHDLLDRFQSAYRTGHSCETALLRLMNDVLCSVDNGDLVLLVLLDLSAAFDVIDHDLLLSRLSNEVGIGGTALRWFQSYLTDRTQRVIVNRDFSNETVLSCGVPQGSVLGPILFSLYTHRLGELIEHHNLYRKLFADDSEMYTSFHPDSDSLAGAVQTVQECFSDIKSWMSANRLKLNDDKTEVILCGSKANLQKVSLPSITLGTSVIVPATTVRDLGLYIDCTLSMVHHISAVVKACYLHLKRLGQLRPLLNRRTAAMVAVSLIQSRLDYCNSCLVGLSQGQLQRLQKVQNTAARIVSRTKKRDHITPVLKDLHWLPVEKRIEHKVLSLAYSCLDGTAPKYLQDLIPRHVPTRKLRSSSQTLLRVPSVDRHKKKSLGARSFECMGPYLWNKLPPGLRQSPSKQAFKSNLKTYLFKW